MNIERLILHALPVVGIAVVALHLRAWVAGDDKLSERGWDHLAIASAWLVIAWLSWRLVGSMRSRDVHC